MTSTHVKKEAFESQRLKELATFVRSRREAISPAMIGIPDTRKRRVKGLRREEVAELAGISTDWYTWIEQGRDLNLSTTTLENISSALKLDDSEKVHLFKLAGHKMTASDSGADSLMQAAVQQLIDSMPEAPAYVLDSLWNIKAWNRAATELFGDFGRYPVEKRNILHLLFAEPEHRKVFTNITETAMCTVSHFRADSAECTHTVEWQNLVQRLLRESEEFAELWSLNSVSWPNTWLKTVNHPTFGKTVYHTLDLELSQPAHLRLVTYLQQ